MATRSVKFGYAGDIAIAYQSNIMNELEIIHTRDTEVIDFFNWYLKINTTKIVTTLFHLY